MPVRCRKCNQVDAHFTKDCPLSGQPADTPQQTPQPALPPVTNNDKPHGTEDRQVFARNVPYTATESELKRFFGKQIGFVEHVFIPKNKETNQSKGFAFVHFKDPTSATEALRLGSIDYDGRIVELKEVSQKRSQPATSSHANHSTGGGSWNTGAFHPHGHTQTGNNNFYTGNKNSGVGRKYHVCLLAPATFLHRVSELFHQLPVWSHGIVPLLTLQGAPTEQEAIKTWDILQEGLTDLVNLCPLTVEFGQCSQDDHDGVISVECSTTCTSHSEGNQLLNLANLMQSHLESLQQGGAETSCPTSTCGPGGTELQFGAAPAGFFSPKCESGPRGNELTKTECVLDALGLVYCQPESFRDWTGSGKTGYTVGVLHQRPLSA